MTGHERRAAATKDAIKDALLQMLTETPFNEIGISALCRKACVGRATFYTHYAGLTEVVDELCDDAISATQRSKTEGLSGIAILAQKMRETTDPEKLAPFMDLLPVCQRVADHPKYHILFTDPFISEYMLMRIYRRERIQILPYLSKNYRITEEEADKVILFGIAGAFAVNKSMGWKKDEAWYQVQRVLLTYMEGGFSSLSKLK